MKLLIITPYFYPNVGGVENYAYNLAKLMIQKGINVVVTCSNFSQWKSKTEDIKGIHIYRIPYAFKVSGTPVNPFWYKRIATIVDNEKPDIINGHIPVPFIADIAARVAAKKEIPFVLTYHNDMAGHNILMNLLSKLYYRCIGYKTFALCRKIIATSKYYAEKSPHLKKFYGKLEFVPPGVNTKRYNTKGTPYLRSKYDLKDDKIVLFVGHLYKGSKHKGLDYLIKALKTVRDSVKNVKLIIVGKGDYEDYYIALAKAQGILDRVIFIRSLEIDNLSRCYNESNVVVLPSYNRNEGFGMVLIEAQACGTPVIGTTVGGIPIAIKDGETGLLVPPKDSNALAEAIIKILCNEELAKKFGEKGYKRVREEFTWAKSTKKTLQIYQEVINDL